LKVAAPEVLRNREEGSDPYSFVVFFEREDAHSLIPVNIIHADVIPSFLENDIVELQVAAFPYHIQYFPDEDAFNDTLDMRIMGRSITYADGIFPLGIFRENDVDKDIVLIKGTVENIKEAESFDGEKETSFLVVKLSTPFGQLEMAHTLEMVDEKQREFVRPGCHVVAMGIISGDVAIKEYRDGAVYNEENCLRLLRSCMKYGDWERFEQALADDCVYRRMDGDIIGRDNVMAKLVAISNLIMEQKVTHFTFLATIQKYDGVVRQPKFDPGKRCVAVSSGTEDDIYNFIFLTLNSGGKIVSIDQASNEGNIYLARIDRVDIPEEPETFRPVQLERSPLEWLELIRTAYDELDFDKGEFYFGLEPTICLSAPDLAEDLHGNEDVYLYFDGQTKTIREQGIPVATEIVEFSKDSHGLLITCGNEKCLLTVQVSARERLQYVNIETTE
jgi:hypothetical protein